MNPIQLASIVLILLALTSSAYAETVPQATSENEFGKRIAAQFKLLPTEAKLLQNKTVRFYFMVDVFGKVQQVVAAESNPAIKSMLEERFKTLNLLGYPPDKMGRVNVNFILN